MKLILSIIVLMFFVGCGEEKSNTATVEVTKPVEAPVKPKIKTPEELYTKDCSSCHGKNAEIKALGKSQVIKGWDAQKIATALSGYIDGSYGGANKVIMKSRANKLSEQEIKSLSEYISKL